MINNSKYSAGCINILDLQAKINQSINERLDLSLNQLKEFIKMLVDNIHDLEVKCSNEKMLAIKITTLDPKTNYKYHYKFYVCLDKNVFVKPKPKPKLKLKSSYQIELGVPDSIEYDLI